MKLTIPVSPYIGELDRVSEVVLSLAGTAPAKHLKLTSEVPTHPEYERATLQLESTELQTMADIGFSGGAEIRAKAGTKVYFFILDLAITFRLDNPDPDSIITSAVYGLGFRVGVSAFEIDASFTNSMADLAARSSLNLAKTSYQVNTRGLGLQALAAVKPLINNAAGPFNNETLETIGAVDYELGKLIAERGKAMRPGVLKVTIDTARLGATLSGGKVHSLAAVIAGQVFALEQAYRNWTGAEAVANVDRVPADKINKDVVAQTYQDLLGVGMNVKPKEVSGVGDRIDRILLAGR